MLASLLWAQPTVLSALAAMKTGIDVAVLVGSLSNAFQASELGD